MWCPKLIFIIIGLTNVADCIQIVAKERSPGCNPVPENTDVILKVYFLIDMNGFLYVDSFFQLFTAESEIPCYFYSCSHTCFVTKMSKIGRP